MPETKKKVACSNVCGEHEIFCSGSRVRISQKGVEVLDRPVVGHCPLHESLYGAKDINKSSVRKSVEHKVENFGFCCRNRCFDSNPIVAYGASEMMSLWLQKDLIDCAIVVCEGTGTIITGNSELVQGVGARLTGIIKTSPIQEVIDYVKKAGGNVLDERTARIDQVEGVRRAFHTGCKNVAVSVAGFQAQAISDIRRLARIERKDACIYSVCNTRTTREDVKHIIKADIVCASASTLLRKEVGSKAILQLGTTIPVYALTQKGKELILAYLATFKDKLVVFRTSKMPYAAEAKGPLLRD